MAQREQLNLRLPPEWFEVLSVGAVLDGDDTVVEYVRRAIGTKVSQLERDPDVAAMLALKAQRRAMADPDSNVRRLEPRGAGDESG